MSVNKAILVGRLGADPDLKEAAGKQICKFSIATNEVWTDKKGQKQESVEWHHVVTWDRMAENCGKYLSKGSQVYVEGKIQTRKYDDEKGNTKYFTEIIARDIKFLSSRKEDGTPAGREEFVATDEDIPF